MLRSTAAFTAALALSLGPFQLQALPSGKALTQYTRTVWTEAQGLPQDTIRAITQTADGYLWLGTDDGLARFDGYEFSTFTKDNRSLPSNSITALWAGRSGELWIGTPNGLTLYSDHRFKTFTTKDGLPSDNVSFLRGDSHGALWIVAGIHLSRYQDRKFTTILPDLHGVGVVRAVYEDPEHQLWVAGRDGVSKKDGDAFSIVVSPQQLKGHIITTMLQDHNAGLWIAGTQGLLLRKPNGELSRFDSRNGLPNNLVRALWEDRSGNLWAGTDAGLSRLEGERFVAPAIERKEERDWVKCLYEDREGNLWAGMNSGLNRFRDDRFTSYGSAEGLPSDAPLAVHQDQSGQMWIGYHDVGLVALSPQGYRAYTEKDGLASNEVFNIRESPGGDLLISTRSGLSRLHGGRFVKYEIDEPLRPHPVYDVLEDARGHLLVASASGVHEQTANGWRVLIPGGPLVNNYPIVLNQDAKGLWAGTYGSGLWRLDAAGGMPRLFTTADGLSSNQIRSLYQDPDGTLWIGTFGGGLSAFRDGSFSRFTSANGLPSDNIAHVEDDGKGNLWLSTTKGICRVMKRQLYDFSAGHTTTLTPVNYTVGDGLRSNQCAPGYPTAGGGTKSRDGRLWFATSRGLASVDPGALAPRAVPPIVQLVEVTADGHAVDSKDSERLGPGVRQVQFRYTGIHLSAPERIRYTYRLEGLESNWQSAAGRRVVSYNTLGRGQYRFVVQAGLPGGALSQASFGFEILPHFYETRWFIWLCAISIALLGYGGYQLRLAQVRGRFSLVLEERMRLAREIHDTLAQGFVGIRSQLDALAMILSRDPETAMQHLEVARKMANHSLTEAKRSVMDLRASDLEDRDLSSALADAPQWAAGNPVQVDVEIKGQPRKLPEQVEKQLLRIAQEAVANTLKHAGAQLISLSLDIGPSQVQLLITDNGRGFTVPDDPSESHEHFGILGMRERAKLLGGKLDFKSRPGCGTTVQVDIPISGDLA